MDAENVTAENEREENKYASILRKTLDSTRQELKDYTERDLGRVLAFITVFLALYLPLSIVLAILSLVNINIMSTSSLAIVLGLAVYYSFS
jgi:hypothetical protein